MRLIPFTALLLASSTHAFGHVTVWPKQSAAGAREKYEVRVPNEKQADTIAVEVRFPAGVKITAFEQKSDWTMEAVRDSSGNAVGVRWAGKLPPQQFAEFGLLAVNPPSPGDLSWSTVQSFSDGTKIEWSGPIGSKTPAPRVSILPASK